MRALIGRWLSEDAAAAVKRASSSSCLTSSCVHSSGLQSHHQRCGEAMTCCSMAPYCKPSPVQPYIYTVL